METAGDILAEALALAGSGRAGEALARLRQCSLDSLGTDSLLDAGRLAEDAGDQTLAEKAYRLAGRKSPDKAGPHAALGRLLAGLNRIDEALAPLRRAAELAPRDDANLNNLSYALEKAGLYEEALEAGLKAHNLGAAQAHRYESLVGLLEQMNRLNEAEPIAREGLSHFPQNAYLHLVLAKCERRSGQAEEAAARLENAQHLPADGHTMAGIQYERAKALDAAGRYADAFAAAGRANRIMARHPAYRQADRTHVFSLLERAEKLPAMAGTVPPEKDAPPPVFLVGFPRSGTTLLGRILDAHPAITLMEERPPLRKALETLQETGLRYPEDVPDMPGEALTDARQAYWQAVAKEAGAAGKTLILDKLPLNILYLPLIRALFPGARIIHALRHPMDAVLSAFMQNFAPNGAMKNFLDIRHAAEFFARVDAFLAARRDSPDDAFITVRYEDVVTDFEKTVGGLLEHLGLDWDAGITRYREKAQKAGRIGTPSYEQVVRPLYTGSIGRWKNYAGQLANIRPVLEPAAKRLGYTL